MARSADAAHTLLAAGGMLLWREPDPGSQVAAGFECRWIDLDRQRQRDDHADAGDGGQPLAERIGLMHSDELPIEFSQSGIEMLNLSSEQRHHLPCLWRATGCTHLTNPLILLAWRFSLAIRTRLPSKRQAIESGC